MRFTEYIYLPSFNSKVLILSEKSGCDIRTDGQTDRQTDSHDESIRVPFFAIWLRNPKKLKNLFVCLFERANIRNYLSDSKNSISFFTYLFGTYASK